MSAATRTVVAAALLTASSTAMAGRLSADLNARELTIECHEGCSILVQPVGSRIHVFDLTSGAHDKRPASGLKFDDCHDTRYFPTQDLPSRVYSYARADVDVVVLNGSGANDHLVVLGLDGPVEVAAGGGNDILVSHGQNTFASLDNGADCASLVDMDYGRVYGRSGNDVIFGESGDYDVYGGDGDDEVYTGDGDDLVKGDSGDDHIETAGGRDLVYGGDGKDNLFVGDGDDIAYGGDNEDWIKLGSGNDFAKGERGDDIILGGPGDDTMEGNRGRDFIRDEEGANDAWGGRDNDELDVTGAGSVVSGSGGHDACASAPNVTLSNCESSL
jgi:hypothetical protein